MLLRARSCACRADVIVTPLKGSDSAATKGSLSTLLGFFLIKTSSGRPSRAVTRLVAVESEDRKAATAFRRPASIVPLYRAFTAFDVRRLVLIPVK